MSSWRQGTKSQYQSSLQKWTDFCKKHNIDIFEPSIPEALEFLATLFNNGASYSTINTARSALSSILLFGSETPFGQLPMVKRFLKGVYELRPSFPKHKDIWDLKLIFDYFRTQDSAANLSLKELTLKVTFLLLLLSGQRCQTVRCLNIDHMQKSTNKYTFHIMEKVKQSRVGTHIAPLQFIRYPDDEKICVVHHLHEYINRTGLLRNSEKQLLISFCKPHGPVSNDTISRWVKSLLLSAGIDTTKFSAHSTRAASASFLASNSISIDDIMKSVGWSSESVFQRFYHKPSEENFNFGNSILETMNKNTDTRQ